MSWKGDEIKAYLTVLWKTCSRTRLDEDVYGMVFTWADTEERLRLLCLEKSQTKRIWYRPAKLCKEEKKLLEKDHLLFSIAHKWENCQTEHLNKRKLFFHTRSS